MTVTPGAASQLGLRTQPGGAALGSPLAPQPIVEIRDAAGNLITSSSASVTVAIATGGGSLGGTTTVTAVAGVATFTGLTVFGDAGPRTLAFASPGLGSIVSAPFTMTAPPVRFIVLDSTSCPVRAAWRLVRFFARESCGKCTPCRIGSTRGVEVIDRLIAGNNVAKQEKLLRDLCDTMTYGSLCALGGLTPYPVLSAIKHFPEDFHANNSI